TCLRREARSKGDFTQRKLAGLDHLHCSVETAAADVTLRRHTHCIGKYSREMEWAEAGQSRKVINSEIFFDILIDVVQHTAHSRMIETMSAACNVINKISIYVILDKACRDHQRGHLRDHAGFRCLFR